MKRLAIRVAFAAAALALPATAADLVNVRVGLVNASSDVGFFIADKKGYFAQEGIKAVFTEFDSGARMVAPLGNAQLEVGAGSVSAGLYNAVARGIEIKIVADKGSTPPGYGFQPLLVRKDHVDSGRYKSLKDLKGMKIAGSAPGSGSTSTLNEALKKAGLKYEEVDRVFLGVSAAPGCASEQGGGRVDDDGADGDACDRSRRCGAHHGRRRDLSPSPAGRRALCRPLRQAAAGRRAALHARLP